MDKITHFRQENSFLSNFYESPAFLDGVLYSSAEAAYQAAKTLDLEQRKVFQTLRPGEAKKAGRKVDLRPDWDQVKLDIMYQIIRSKFDFHPVLKQKLLATGDAILEEGNYWGDTFWGVCNGTGQNHLGLILMRIRKEYGGQ